MPIPTRHHIKPPVEAPDDRVLEAPCLGVVQA
jgi:hypothetical protein